MSFLSWKVTCFQFSYKRSVCTEFNALLELIEKYTERNSNVFFLYGLWWILFRISSEAPFGGKMCHVSFVAGKNPLWWQQKRRTHFYFGNGCGTTAGWNQHRERRNWRKMSEAVSGLSGRVSRRSSDFFSPNRHAWISSKDLSLKL